MPGINSVTIVGRVGKEPKVTTFQSGGKLCSFSLATSEKWKDKNSGEMKEKTEWTNVVIKNDALVGIAEKYVKKGDWCGIQGKLETRKWKDQNGADRYSTEVVIGLFNGTLTLLGNNSGDGSQSSDGGDRPAASAASGRPAYDIGDDDIPF